MGTVALGSNGVATLNLSSLKVGTHSLTASYAGDDADYPATAPAFTQTVQLRSSRTLISSSSTNASDPQQVTLFVVVQSNQLSPLASPTGSVTLYNGTTLVSTSTLDKNSTAAFTVRLETGATGTFTAKYTGDNSYAASTSDATSVKSGAASQFSLTLSDTSLSVPRAQHVAVTITAKSVNGFNDTLKLGCVGLPYAATCTFTSNGSINTNMTLPANGNATLSLMIDTGNPLGSGSQGSGGNLALRRTTGAVLCLLPACLLLCGKHRRRRIWPVLLVLFAAAASIGATGCGGLSINSTPAGTYTFQVTAVGQGTGASQSQAVTLVVGQ